MKLFRQIQWFKWVITQLLKITHCEDYPQIEDLFVIGCEYQFRRGNLLEVGDIPGDEGFSIVYGYKTNHRVLFQTGVPFAQKNATWSHMIYSSVFPISPASTSKRVSRARVFRL